MQSFFKIIDQTAETFQFPMLDNGYIYLASSKLSVFKKDNSWALVFEIFGYNPRSGDPDISIYTISNEIYHTATQND